MPSRLLAILGLHPPCVNIIPHASGPTYPRTLQCRSVLFNSGILQQQRRHVRNRVKFCGKLCSVSCQSEKRGCASCLLAAVLVVVLAAVLVVVLVAVLVVVLVAVLVVC